MTLEKPFWYELCENEDLRFYFLRLANAFTRNTEFQEDLYQEAWCRIGQCRDDCRIEYYKAVGRRAMDALYRKEKRYWRFIAGDYSGRRDAIRKRLKRKT